MLMSLPTLCFQWERPGEENWNRDFIIFLFLFFHFPRQPSTGTNDILSTQFFSFYYDEFLSPEREVISESLEQHANLSFW